MINPYLNEIENNIYRLLALYDNDSTSPTYGIGDRFHWAWGLIDFANGTFQGAANGLSRLLNNQALPSNITQIKALKIIDAMFIGTDRIRKKNGSMEEAFPNEGSYCVTALVTYDLLTAVEQLEKHISKQKKSIYLEIIK